MNDEVNPSFALHPPPVPSRLAYPAASSRPSVTKVAMLSSDEAGNVSELNVLANGLIVASLIHANISHVAMLLKLAGVLES